MTSKGKKKKGTAMSLSEFHALPLSAEAAPAPVAPMSSWADEMEQLDNTDSSTPPSNFIFDRSVLPTAPKSTLAPDINYDLLPKEAPFTAFISNISFEADEDKIRALFKDLDILKVRLVQDERGRSRGYGYIDFGTRDSLISGLSKTNIVLNNRSIKIQLDDPNRSHQAGGGSSFGGSHGRYNNHSESTTLKSDEADWRRAEPEPEQPASSRPSYNNNRYQNDNRHSTNRYNNNNNNNNSDNNSNRGGYQRRSGGSSYNSNNNRMSSSSNSNINNRPNSNYSNRSDYNSSSRMQFNRNTDHQQHNSYNQPQQQHQNINTNSETSVSVAADNLNSTSPTTSTSELKERPKLQLAPRTLPVEQVGQSTAVSSSIFGSAKPVDTAAKEREIEERLKQLREKEAAERREKAAQAAAAGETLEEVPATPEVNENDGPKRSQKTSFTSDDGNRPPAHQRQDSNEFQTVGSKRAYNNRNDNKNRISQSTSFTSPTSNYQKRVGAESGDVSGEAPKAVENVWKRKTPVVDLFNKEGSESGGIVRSTSSTSNFRPNDNRSQNRSQMNRDSNNNSYKDRRPNQGSASGGKQGYGGGSNAGGANRRQHDNKSYNKDRQYGFDSAGGAGSAQTGGTYASAINNNIESGVEFNNKFSNLQIDVDEAEVDY